jgi:hypothetical protein
LNITRSVDLNLKSIFQKKDTFYDILTSLDIDYLSLEKLADPKELHKPIEIESKESMADVEEEEEDGNEEEDSESDSEDKESEKSDGEDKSDEDGEDENEKEEEEDSEEDN